MIKFSFLRKVKFFLDFRESFGYIICDAHQEAKAGLDWIKGFIQEYGYAPSYDKIRKYSGFNLNLLLYKGFQKFLLR